MGVLIMVGKVLPKLNVDQGFIPDPEEERDSFFAEYGLTTDHCLVAFCRGIRAALLETRWDNEKTAVTDSLRFFDWTTPDGFVRSCVSLYLSALPSKSIRSIAGKTELEC